MDESNAARMQRLRSQLESFLDTVLRDAPLSSYSGHVAKKWSAQENLAHLARYHEIFLERMERILAEDSPVFSRYRAEEDPAWSTWQLLPISEIIRRMQVLRTTLNGRLSHLSDNDFKRTGVHSKFGAMPLSLWLEFFLLHESHHLYQAFQQVRE